MRIKFIPPQTTPSSDVQVNYGGSAKKTWPLVSIQRGNRKIKVKLRNKD